MKRIPIKRKKEKEVIKKLALKKEGFDLHVDKIPITLRDRYSVPPFSVFNTQIGDWQSRRRAWMSLGIKSEIGRGDNLLHFSDRAQLKRKDYGQAYNQKSLNNIVSQRRHLTFHGNVAEYDYYRVKEGTVKHTIKSGTSVFDPVLCELMYSWFCPSRGVVLDPFAGGSVRGIVASVLGRRYLGIELSEQQIEANEIQREGICRDPLPRWVLGDAKDIKSFVTERFDFLFSCPPYYNLEVYSDDPRDISTCKTYEEFLDVYGLIIKESVSLLRNNSFASFVVSDVRSKDPPGRYYGFVSDTINKFRDAGMLYYNEIILVNAIGTLPIRAGRIFESNRKVGRAHQNVLIFLKGDIDKAVRKLKDRKETI